MAESLNNDNDNQNQDNGGLGKFKSWKQKEAAMNNVKNANKNKQMGAVKTTTRMTKKKELALKKGRAKRARMNMGIAKTTQLNFAKNFIETRSIKQAAAKTGIDVNRATDILSRIEKSGTLAEAFKLKGLDYDSLANNLKDLIDYNKQKVEKPVGLDRSIKEMRDARVALDSIKTVAKFTAISADTLATNQIEFSSSQILLAIKSLVQKLNADELKIVVESCEYMLAEMARVAKVG